MSGYFGKQYFLTLIFFSKNEPMVKCINNPPESFGFHNNCIPHWWEIVIISLRPFRPYLGAKQTERRFSEAIIIFTRDCLQKLSKCCSALIIHLHDGSFMRSFSLSGRKWQAFSQGHLTRAFSGKVKTCWVVVLVGQYFLGIILFYKFYPMVKYINHPPKRLCFHNNFIPH